jgi:hypothetical protein
MTTSRATESRAVVATGVNVDDTELHVDLSDGRRLSVPLAWFPTLLRATSTQRKAWRFIGGGEGIHWDEIDEDLSVRGLRSGRT